MKNGIIITINWSIIGAQLALESDEEQIQFFKAFTKEVQTYPTQHQIELQMYSINTGLTTDERDILKGISYDE